VGGENNHTVHRIDFSTQTSDICKKSRYLLYTASFYQVKVVINGKNVKIIYICSLESKNKQTFILLTTRKK